ncbi:MAG: kelch repeat-containing protein [bacterium]
MKKLLLISALFIPLLFVCSFSQLGHWEKLNPENNPGYRVAHGMANIGNQKVLLFGGGNDIGALNDTWIYNLSSNNWSKIICSNSPEARFYHSMCAISDSIVLLFGGCDDYNDFDDLWLFNSNSLNWSKLNPSAYDKIHLPQATIKCGMAKLNDSLAIVYGGAIYDSTWGYTNTSITWFYNINQNSWKFLDYGFPKGREGHKLINLLNNKVLICGGAPSIPNGYNENWIFNLEDNSWRFLNDVKIKIPIISGHCSAKINEGISVIFGGSTNTISTNDTWYDSTWVFNFYEKCWYKLNIKEHPSDRYYPAMAQIDIDKALLFGGVSKKNQMPDDTWLFILDSIPISVTDYHSNQPEIKTFINSNNELILDFCLPENKNADIEIFNLHGKSVLKENYQVQRGWNREVIPFDNLPSGVYFVRVRAGMEYLMDKFLVF